MARGPLTEQEVRQYHEDGFVLARGMFDKTEIELLRRSAKDDKALDDHSFGKADDEGGVVRLSLWNHPGDGIYGMFARCRSLVDSAEALLGGEVYHYHSKMIMKEPRVGGAWAWHQDYGYWYQNGVLFPLLTSVSIAVDRATRENGCLQVLKGSHLAGRVDHVLTGDQAGADLERVKELAAAPGTGLRRDGAGRRRLLRLQPAAPHRPEPLRTSALVDDLLLQRGAQRSLQRVAPSALHAAQQSGRRHDPGSRRQAIRGRRLRRGVAGSGEGRQRQPAWRTRRSSGRAEACPTSCAVIST